MHLVCPACATVNRVPDERLGDEPVCARCKTELMASKPVALADAVFSTYVERSGMPVVVDFWADWCGPCKMMAPHFEAAAAQMPQVRFAKVDTEANPRASATNGIRSIPTIVLFHGGREVARRSGAVGAAELVQWLRATLGARG